MDAPASAAVAVIKQHLIDPEICIRCNTCEATCPVGAITHDSRNYVVDPAKCEQCLACVPPCPTGSIDNWRTVARARAYSIDEQFGWDALPAELSSAELSGAELDAHEGAAPMAAQPAVVETGVTTPPAQTPEARRINASLPPWSAAHAYTNLYGPKAPTTATVAGNVSVTAAGFANDTHHIVLDLGAMPLPVLEGQSIGIVPPGVDATGRPHVARQYSIASPRNGERAGYNNLSLTVKRVTVDHDGRPVRGVASNYLCDLQVGDPVQVIGPFGNTFLMPNHPRSHLVMICTGTGSAPMRAMTEWRRRLRQSGKFAGGRLLLFFGARTQQELPYFGPLMNLPKDFIDVNLAYSRTPGEPRRYVQDAMRERAGDLADLLADPDAYFFVCGIQAMERGVIEALRDIATAAGQDWQALAAEMQRTARLHVETY